MRSRIYILVVLAVLFATFNYAVFSKERQLSGGKEILLRLAPVDPRALLMGDYVTLRYSLNDKIRYALWQAASTENPRAGQELPRKGGSGFAVVRAVREGEGIPGEVVFARLEDDIPLGPDESRVAYKIRAREVVTASTAFYFQEGRGAVYERAVFARLRLDDDGKTLLVALANAKGEDIRVEEEKRDVKGARR